MFGVLLISTTCLVGAALAATFFTQPVPEDPAHPGQCYDTTTGTWHAEGESWNKGGECLESTCFLSVGYLDSGNHQRNLEKISPGVYGRYRDDPGRHSSPSPFPSDSKNRTLLFKVRGRTQEFVYNKGDEPLIPRGFLYESIVSCMYHTKLPSNCREIRQYSSLPFPSCCPQLSCVGDPLGPIEAVG